MSHTASEGHAPQHQHREIMPFHSMRAKSQHSAVRNKVQHCSKARSQGAESEGSLGGKGLPAFKSRTHSSPIQVGA